MRTAAPPLLPIFRSRLQGEVLALILGRPDQQWTIDELATSTGHAYQTVANEIRRLEPGGLLVTRDQGRTKLISANQSSPYYGPLRDLVLMSFGPPVVIEDEFASIDGVEQLVIFGSWAARYEGEPGPLPNDIDVLVVGQPDRDGIYDAAQRAQQRLHREVNVTLRTPRQWREAEDGFTRQVRDSPLLELSVREPSDATLETRQ